jgi:hypothetical protein
MEKGITLRKWCLQTGVDPCRVSDIERQVTFRQPTKEERQKFTDAGFECMEIQYEIDPEKVKKEAIFYKDMIEMDKTEWRFKYMAFPFCKGGGGYEDQPDDICSEPDHSHEDPEKS